MTSGKTSTCRSPATTKSSGPSLLPAIRISSAPRKAVARSPAPPSSSIFPPKTLPPAPPPLTSIPRRATPSPLTSTSTISANLFASLLPFPATPMTSFCCGQPMNQRYTSLGKIFVRHFIRSITCLLMVLCVSLPAYPFDSPLSDEAVREAYYLGHQEFVRITVEIYLTNSYGALIPNPAATRSSSSPPLIPRHYDFWRDFRVQVSDGHQILSPSDSEGRPLYRCGRYGPCRPRGAAIDLEFPASAFASDSITVEVTPPEGDSVSVDFDLTRLR